MLLRICRANCFTSSSEMRPFGPVPDTWLMSTPISRATRRTEGAAGAVAVLGTGGTVAAAGGGVPGHEVLPVYLRDKVAQTLAEQRR